MSDDALDDEVARLVARGDEGAAAAAAVRALGPDLCGFLITVLGNEDDGREVFAETCEQVLRSVARFRGESSVKTWVYRIGWRTSMRWKSSGGRKRERRFVTSEHGELAESIRDSTAAYRKTEAKDWLARARDQLSPEEQSLLTLRLDRGMTWQDVAFVMAPDGAPATVARLRKQYQRIKDRLREWAERDGFLGQRDG